MELEAKERGTVTPDQFKEWLYEYATRFKQDADEAHRERSMQAITDAFNE